MTKLVTIINHNREDLVVMWDQMEEVPAVPAAPAVPASEGKPAMPATPAVPASRKVMHHRSNIGQAQQRQFDMEKTGKIELHLEK